MLKCRRFERQNLIPRTSARAAITPTMNMTIEIPATVPLGTPLRPLLLGEETLGQSIGCVSCVLVVIPVVLAVVVDLVSVVLAVVVGLVSVVLVVVDGTGQSGSTLNKKGLTDTPDGSSIEREVDRLVK